MLTSSVVLFPDNAHPHTDARSRALLEYFNWELFDHPPYSPDLPPSDYHLFTHLKNWLGSWCFNNDEQMEGVKTWLSLQVINFFHIDIQKLIPLYNCLNFGGDYVKK
jgi:transposase